jgi:hypothetical protein
LLSVCKSKEKDETKVVEKTVPPDLKLKIVRSARKVNLCALSGSLNKQRLFPYTALTDWFL